MNFTRPMVAGGDPHSDAEFVWWRHGVFYQVYVRSFGDANGDGVGDLRGLHERLPYLVDLGVDAVWLSPIYPSPMHDFGYDVAAYCDIDPRYGDLDEFDRLVAGTHDLGLRVVLDWVPNHTSEEHPWFVESRSSPETSRRDWYVWRPGRGSGVPPNNWQSAFEDVGPAWTFDACSGEWYLHSFLPQQPDLDWSNPQFEAAMHDVLRFWMERGVDGFRIDVVQALGKDPELGDNPFPVIKPTPASVGVRRDEDWWPTLIPRLERLRAVVDEYRDRVAVGEAYVLGPERLRGYRDARLHLVHNFLLMHQPWAASSFRSVIAATEQAEGREGWPAWVTANHDHPRAATRWRLDGSLRRRVDEPLDGVDPEVGVRRAELMAVMLLTLRGTPFIYQGEELGLGDAVVPAEAVVDVDGRDAVRTPLPWQPPTAHSPAAGFSAAVPWLLVHPAATERNVAHQRANPASTLALYRTLLRLRRANSSLHRGALTLLDAADDVLAYQRGDGPDSLVVALNFSQDPRRMPPVGDLRWTTPAATALHNRQLTGLGAVIADAPR